MEAHDTPFDMPDDGSKILLFPLVPLFLFQRICHSKRQFVLLRTSAFSFQP
ncbi:hypothetical protein QR685DRAFT_444341 [Neurospora intermedia]|uniref:Uncharacterized protein n=1 Tax=Neurospora intermedia TaxID=5142 RepID=A0ABR3DAD1_NEUIN